MQKMIEIESGFQYSINIGYDLNDDKKIKKYIPTRSALDLLFDVLQSTRTQGNNRARVLVGPYGKGKSHIVLMILSYLMKKDRSLFKHINEKLPEYAALKQELDVYYETKGKLLPVVITGSSTILTQSLMRGLQQTLSDNNLAHCLPSTNFKAAIEMIEKWKTEYPDTYSALQQHLNESISVFVNRLEGFDVKAYESFEKIYPFLTAGSCFNPYVGFDVVELYEKTAENLKSEGYRGIYIVFDEFSKYLEAHAADSSSSETKLLQDLAEKCNRSQSAQLHVMLISHKDIINYMDNLPKKIVDGWRGVSERFTHVHLHNNFIQMYEIIGTVIKKDTELWKKFLEKNDAYFQCMYSNYGKRSLFDELGEQDRTILFQNAYPLHPSSIFILPRLSEQVAQNERTLFTFLSADSADTLKTFLKNQDGHTVQYVTPDIIYDYFEPLLKQESYQSHIHEIFRLADIVLKQIEAGDLRAKIVKTLALIYIIEQFEKLAPTKDEIVNIYQSSYDLEVIEDAINSLIDEKFVIYVRRSNSYLKLKESIGIDIKQTINDYIETLKGKFSLENTLNNSNFDRFMYPVRYNDEREMTRYFSFEFITATDLTNTDALDMLQPKTGDGAIFAVLVSSQEEIDIVQKLLLDISRDRKEIIFVTLKSYLPIRDIAQEFQAVQYLRNQASGDKNVFDEYDLIYDDLSDIIANYIHNYTRPEVGNALYIQNGQVLSIKRKTELTKKLSDICDEIFAHTPILVNEAINIEEPSKMAIQSRKKITAALLRNPLEPKLGFEGSGQEVSIARSILVKTNLLSDIDTEPYINISNLKDKGLISVFDSLRLSFEKARNEQKISFQEIYDTLQNKDNGIGLRKGVIPIFLAIAYLLYGNSFAIRDSQKEISLSSDVLEQINKQPDLFYLSYVNRSETTESNLRALRGIFAEYINNKDLTSTPEESIANAIRKWYMMLPKYARELKIYPNGNSIEKELWSWTKFLKSSIGPKELLFKYLPEAFGVSGSIKEQIEKSKVMYDSAVHALEGYLVEEVKKIFFDSSSVVSIEDISLTSVIKDWCQRLDNTVFEQLFDDGSERILNLCREIDNDEVSFIGRMGKLLIGLRFDDWRHEQIPIFLSKVRAFKDKIESFENDLGKNIDENYNCVLPPNSYQLFISNDAGEVKVKRFERVETNGRAKLLHNQITSALEAMGQALSPQEKRQIVFDILKDLC